MKNQCKSLCSSAVFALLMLLSSAILATVPQGINYQAVVRNNSGLALPHQHINARFTLRSDSLTGAIAYRESDTITSNALGIFTVVIGGGNFPVGNFNTLNWATTAYFLQVEMDITGGTTFVDMGTSKLMTVPYAFYAARAGSIFLASDTFPTVTTNDTIEVGDKSNVVVSSSVLPVNAVMGLTNGLQVGQLLYLEGRASGANGVRFESAGNVNVGNSGGPVDLTNGAMLCLMWNGTHWLRVSYSSNQ